MGGVCSRHVKMRNVYKMLVGKLLRSLQEIQPDFVEEAKA
jgi:hypothetical protein